jgi:hypothetical protein
MQSALPTLSWQLSCSIHGCGVRCRVRAGYAKAFAPRKLARPEVKLTGFFLHQQEENVSFDPDFRLNSDRNGHCICASSYMLTIIMYSPGQSCVRDLKVSLSILPSGYERRGTELLEATSCTSKFPRVKCRTLP